MSSGNDSSEQNDSHDDELVACCECTESCFFPALSEIAKSFSCMAQKEKMLALRAMMLVLASPPGETNKLFKTNRLDTANCASEASKRVTVRYALLGKPVCRDLFSKVLNVSITSLKNQASSVTSETGFNSYSSNRGANRKGKLSAQSCILISFLKRYSELYGMPCPRGRGSEDGQPLRVLPSSTTFSSVHDSYCEKWNSISNAALEEEYIEKKPDSPLSLSQFRSVWNRYYNTLKIGHRGSDFCDFCVTTSLRISTANSEDERDLVTLSNNHKAKARLEYKGYCDIRRHVQENPSGETVHLVFDYAEKVTLPSMIRQPGQIHFVTGLRYDLFGISITNLNRTRVFGLPEGHWPGTKDATTVLSMLYHVVKEVCTNPVTKNARKLVLHADNCSGQNKNRFTLWFLCWLVCNGVYEEIELRFLIAGHTKNVCDGAFGHIKRVYRRSEVLDSSDMHDVINRSCDSTTIVRNTEVDWLLWKDILEDSFTVPSQLKITHFHIFGFNKSNLGNVLVKEVTSSPQYTQFRLLKTSKDPYRIGVNIRRLTMNASMKATWPKLEDVQSAKEGNRKDYLNKHICDRYYATDDTFKSRYYAA